MSQKEPTAAVWKSFFSFKGAIGALVLSLLLVAMFIGAGILEGQSKPERIPLRNLPANERAEFALERGNWRMASQALGEMLEEDPFDSRSLFYMGYSLHKLDRPEEAIPWYLKARDFYNYRLTCHYQLACIYAQQGQSQLAIAELEEAVQRGFRTRGGLDSKEALKSLWDEVAFQAVVAREAENRAKQ